MNLGLSLAVDGSTYAGSAAVIREQTILAARQLPERATPGRAGREEHFLPMVAACLDAADVKPTQVARVICGAGPGSFTSLRVAASIAKGIAVGAGCPLYAVSSLMLMVAGREPGRYLATLPAMRGEVFAGLFAISEDASVNELSRVEIIPEDSAGDRATREGATVISSSPHAESVAGLLPVIAAGGICDLATWEPMYGRAAEAQVRWEAAHGRPLTPAG